VRRPAYSGQFQARRQTGPEAPDWLLIYRIDGDTVRFERTGRHADLFDA
jgi:mRNA interferase YafQ